MELDSVKSQKEEVRDPRTGELRSTTWTTTQAVLIGSWNVAKIYKNSGQIGQLISKGVPLTINEPAYTYTKLVGKRVNMLAMAPKNCPGTGAGHSLGAPTPTPAHSRSPPPTQRRPVTAAPATAAQSRRTSLL